MSRKPLPKAITRSLEDVHALAGAAANGEPRASLYAVPFDAVEAEPEPAPARPVPRSQGPEEVSFSTMAKPRPEATADEIAMARRRYALARQIVDRHKTYAALSGLSPIPIANVAGVAAMILRMVKQLSEIYQVSFDRDRTRAVILGILGGAVPMGLGATTATTLAFVMPAGALVGLGVCAMSAGAVTRGIGLVFIDSFENGVIPGQSGA